MLGVFLFILKLLENFIQLLLVLLFSILVFIHILKRDVLMQKLLFRIASTRLIENITLVCALDWALAIVVEKVRVESFESELAIQRLLVPIL